VTEIEKSVFVREKMNDYPLNIRHEKQLKTVLGVNDYVYHQLVAAFDEYLNVEYAARMYLWYNNRLQKRPVKVTNAILGTAPLQVAFVLYFLKNYPPMETFAERFNMDKSTANNNLKFYLLRLEAVLSEWKALPQRSFANTEELEAYLRQHNLVELIVDATERKHHRPKNDVEQRALYSGKKSPHDKEYRH